MGLEGKPGFLLCVVALSFFALARPCIAQTVTDPTSLPNQQSSQKQNPDETTGGNVSGTVVDQTGATVTGARVQLTRDDQIPGKEAQSGEDGKFSFTKLPAGDFHIAVTAPGFAAQTFSGTLHEGEMLTTPPIVMAIAGAETDVQVALSAPEVAEAQVKDEEKQRVLRVIPNFYVTYDPHPLALDAKQKFELAWKTTIDPFTFAVVGAIAGLQQAQNDFSGYGPGPEGYGKRYGAAYANVVAGTFLGSAILPSVLKQDPRYFYKGTGSRHSRLLYALANAVICKGDNGRWQTNYSNIFGNLAAGGISNLYYPAEDRSTSLTFENGFIGIGATGAANVFQEFFVKKFTHVSNRDASKP